jgi:hypothetical protein
MSSPADKKKIQKCWEDVFETLPNFPEKGSDEHKRRRNTFTKTMKLLLRDIAVEELEQAEAEKAKSVKKKSTQKKKQVTIEEEPKKAAVKPKKKSTKK